MPPTPRRTSSVHSSQPNSNTGSKKREATVYDAVAGRCSTQRFIPSTPYTSRMRDTQTSSTLPIPPEEVLFRRIGAPERDIHDDFYWADRHLNEKQTLPDSDLLKAVHAYAADFYSAKGQKGEVGFGSMDETALLAMGILLEESAKEILGETGDMIFVEGEEEEKPRSLTKREKEVAKLEKESKEREALEVAQREQEQEQERERAKEEPRGKTGRKRRKKRHGQTAGR